MVPQSVAEKILANMGNPRILISLFLQIHHARIQTLLIDTLSNVFVKHVVGIPSPEKLAMIFNSHRKLIINQQQRLKAPQIPKIRMYLQIVTIINVTKIYFRNLSEKPSSEKPSKSVRKSSVAPKTYLPFDQLQAAARKDKLAVVEAKFLSEITFLSEFVLTTYEKHFDVINPKISKTSTNRGEVRVNNNFFAFYVDTATFTIKELRALLLSIWNQSVEQKEATLPVSILETAFLALVGQQCPKKVCHISGILQATSEIKQDVKIGTRFQVGEIWIGTYFDAFFFSVNQMLHFF